MNLSASDIRDLRCRMGWCQADLARRLACSLDVVAKYESGESEIDAAHGRLLSAVFHQAEAAAHRILRRPVAEILMRDRGISQIHDFDVLQTCDGAFTNALSNATVPSATPGVAAPAKKR